MILEEPKVGLPVYCEETQQVYMIEGWDFDHRKLALKNLSNLEAPLTHIDPAKLRELPDNWGTKTYYEEMTRNIMERRAKSR